MDASWSMLWADHFDVSTSSFTKFRRIFSFFKFRFRKFCIAILYFFWCIQIEIRVPVAIVQFLGVCRISPKSLKWARDPSSKLDILVIVIYLTPLLTGFMNPVMIEYSGQFSNLILEVSPERVLVTMGERHRRWKLIIRILLLISDVWLITRFDIEEIDCKE